MRPGNLWIVRLSEHLSDQVNQWVQSLDWTSHKTIGIQVIRSADSVTANIVEGFGRSGAADKLRFYYIARGSLEETVFWLRRARDRELLDYSAATLHLASYWRLSTSLQAFIRAHKRRNNL